MPDYRLFGGLGPRRASYCSLQLPEILLNCSVKVRSFRDGHTANRFRWQFRKELTRILRRLLLYVSSAQKLLRLMVMMFLAFASFCCFERRKWHQGHQHG